MSTGLSPAASKQKPRRDSNGPVEGLPSVNYRLPLIVTLLATVAIVLVLGVLTAFALLNALYQGNIAGTNQTGASPVNATLCGCITILGLAGFVFFLWALTRGARDLFAPLYFARGEVADKKRAGSGRLSGSWLGVHVRYLGPEVDKAADVSDEQRASSADRSKIVQPRFASDARQPARRPGASSGYLPAERISAATSREPNEEPGKRMIFRLDQQSYGDLDVGDEVIVAHSRFLQHIYYIAHLRDGRWYSYTNKQLI